jgi:hypothetical protein
MDRQDRNVWQVKNRRCTLTPQQADPPFVVRVYRDDALIFEAEFRTHDAATIAAIDQLHITQRLADER